MITTNYTAQWLTIKHFRSFTILHTKTLDYPLVILLLVIVVVALDVIYWFITLKDLFVSRSITSFFLNYGMSFLGEEGLVERNRKGHGGVKNVHFLGDILNGYSPISGENAILTKRRANSR